jgi:tetratricopeptide (TPR) repeat protein
MKFFSLYIILQLLSINPFTALVLVAIIYIFIDRRYIGILPDFIQPIRRWRKAAELKRAVGFSPNPGLAYYDLGALQVDRGKMAEGRISLEKAHDLIADHPDIEYYLGVARIRTGALDIGKEAMENALRLNSKVKYGFPYVYLIEYSLKNQEPQEQIESYLEKIYENENPRLFYETGLVFQQERQIERAKEMFQQVQVSLNRCPAFMKKQYRFHAIKARIRNALM